MVVIWNTLLQCPTEIPVHHVLVQHQFADALQLALNPNVDLQDVIIIFALHKRHILASLIMIILKMQPGITITLITIAIVIVDPFLIYKIII